MCEGLRERSASDSAGDLQFRRDRRDRIYRATRLIIHEIALAGVLGLSGSRSARTVFEVKALVFGLAGRFADAEDIAEVRVDGVVIETLQRDLVVFERDNVSLVRSLKGGGFKQFRFAREVDVLEFSADVSQRVIKLVQLERSVAARNRHEL